MNYVEGPLAFHPIGQLAPYSVQPVDKERKNKQTSSINLSLHDAYLMLPLLTSGLNWLYDLLPLLKLLVHCNETYSGKHECNYKGQAKGIFKYRPAMHELFAANFR